MAWGRKDRVPKDAWGLAWGRKKRFPHGEGTVHSQERGAEGGPGDSSGCSKQEGEAAGRGGAGRGRGRGGRAGRGGTGRGGVGRDEERRGVQVSPTQIVSPTPSPSFQK